jgi:hypothetical protein
MTIYYTTGTVTVTNNSTAVTGVGTAWLTNGIRAGDWLIVRNQIGVIASVASNTSLTLETAWVPATASASAYAIARVDDGVRALQASNDLLAAFNGGPAQGRFGDGSAATPGVGFTAQTNTGLFRPATSVLALSVNGTERMRLTTTGAQLTGLLTGTAVVANDADTTAGRLLTTGAGPEQAFRRGNILGTVSQTGGVPKGAVIQRGSGANGEFVRFADGTQICTHALPVGSIIALGSGTYAGPYRTNTTTWTFPATFAVAPRVGATPLCNTSSIRNLSAGSATVISTTSAQVIVSRVSSDNFDIAFTADCIAVGRWF